MRHLRGAQGLLRALQHGQYGRRQALRRPLRPLGGGRQLRALLASNLLPKVRRFILRFVSSNAYNPETVAVFLLTLRLQCYKISLQLPTCMHA